MLSLLIVNWNTREVLAQCLASISKHAPSLPYEVLVLDNASRDGSAEMVAERFPECRLVASGRNVGYAAGNNALFAEARGDLLLTLNPDTAFEDDTLDRAVEAMGHDASVLAVRLVGTDGCTQRSVRGFPTALGIFGDFSGLGTLFPGSSLDSYRMTGFDYESAGPAPQPMGTFLLFRRSALEAVGDPRKPFDERFPIFFNDVDLLYRLARAGHTCWYRPDLHVLHHGGESTRQVRKSMIWESHRSLVRYLWKHHSRGLALPATLALSCCVYVAAFLRARGYDGGFRA